MHRVLNMGSILQAYALQESVRAAGFSPEIVDYVYPNVEHQMYLRLDSAPPPTLSLSHRIFSKIKSLILKGKNNNDSIRRHKFEKFMADFYNLSNIRYENRFILDKLAPQYDIYLTGSDQVWNPNYVGYDTSFMLGFVRDKKVKKIAYAPSISVTKIPDQFRESYSNRLKEYSFLSVREKDAVGIVENLSGKKVVKVCDPTLLLSREEWIRNVLNENTDLINQKKYFVIFILNYKFNPYPKIFDIIEQAHKIYGGKMVVLHGEMSDYMKLNDAKFIATADPKDFIYYLSHARFMVTTSFHGSVFALNFSIPFLCALDTTVTDTRIPSLLADYGAERFGIPIDSKCVPTNLECDKRIEKKIEELRKYSKDYLIHALNC